jgi:glycosyltransferase involved in cell wall biosynthesis
VIREKIGWSSSDDAEDAASRSGSSAARSTAAPIRVIWLAPAPGSGGIGDYAEQLVADLRDCGAELYPFHLAPPLGDGAIDVLRAVHRVRAGIKRIRGEGPAVVHAELSAGGIEPFWALPPGDPLVTATVHDPPHFAWWPLYSRGIAKTRVVHQALHFPARRLWWRFEDRRMRNATHFTLTAGGAAALVQRGLKAGRLVHHVPERSPGPPVEERPLAVGLFGYRYVGKGFELLSELRRELPSDIEIHVAGRGTESLELPCGTTGWGAVGGKREDEFFGSMRCILLPYESGGRYGPFLSASGAAARALAYGTPVVSTPVRGFLEEAEISSAVTLTASESAEDLAAGVNSLIRGGKLLRRSGEDALRLRLERTTLATAERMVTTWRELLDAR